MADELTISGNVGFVKNGKSVSFGKTGLTIDVAGKEHSLASHNVGTSEEALLKGAVGTIGMIAIYNSDPTNYVEYRPATTVPAIKILAGEFQMFRANTSAPMLIANTAACDVEYLVIEA